MNRRSVIQRGDLLRCLQGTCGGERRFVAELCGFEGAEPPERLPSEPVIPTIPFLPPRIEVEPPRLATTGTVQFLRAVRSQAKEPEPPAETAERTWLEQLPPLTPEELSGRNVPPPPTPPLQSWARTWPFLRDALGGRREGTRLEPRAAVRDAARMRPFHRLPRIKRRVWARHASVFLDGRESLACFRDDMRALVEEIKRWRGAEGLSLFWLTDGSPAGQAHRLPAPETVAAKPEAGGPVLALSDLGCLGGGTALGRVWSDHAHRWRRQGIRCSALLPCPRDRWSAEVAAAWDCAGWDRGERRRRGGQPPLARKENPADANQKVERLLTLLTPAARCERGLLRSLRLLLNQDADVGTEFDVWNHPECVN
ncbi:MAG TPA: hypothetical protein DCE44_16205, partial [Verrucomicrobiales bacterium]|nr:hypothetical protein [Verrucomicrobiales bacterium]